MWLKMAEGSNSQATEAADAIHTSRFQLDSVIFYLLLLALAWTPLWFGSDRTIAWGINALLFGALTALNESYLVVAGRPYSVPIRKIWFSALAVFLVIGWDLLQISPWAPHSLNNPIWDLARDTLGREVPGKISVNPDATAFAVVRFTTAALVFWLSFQLCRAPGRAQRFLEAMALVCALYAAYGIIAFFLFPDALLWFEKIYYRDSLTATFVNRNSYATYAGIGLMCALSRAMSHYVGRVEGRGASVGRRIASVLGATVEGGGIWLGASFVSAVALLLTGSRGGVSASLAGVVALALLVGARGAKNAVAVGFGLVATGLLIGAVLFIFGDFLANRLSIQGFSSDERLSVYALTWRSIMDAPLRGFGDGTFAYVFPMYRDATIGSVGVWDMAHNTYLELLQGLGLPIGLFLLAAIAGLGGRCVYGSLTRRRPPAACWAAAAATVIVGLHAFVDFSLQIQSVTLTWAALLGAGVAQSWSSRSR